MSWKCFGTDQIGSVAAIGQHFFEFSLMVWVKGTSTDFQFNWGLFGSNTWFGCFDSSANANIVRCRDASAVDYDTSGNFPISSGWRNVVMTFLYPSQIKLYVNGVDTGGQALSGINWPSGFMNPMTFAFGGWAAATDLWVSHMTFWNHQLVAADALALTSGGAAGAGKYPTTVQPANVFYHWAPNNFTDTKNGHVLTVNGSPFWDTANLAPVEADPGGGTLTKRWRIPTSVANGTQRRLVLWSDVTGATVLQNAVLTANAGYFKQDDSGLTVGQFKPGVLLGFGADQAADARGSACWAEGIQE